MPRHMWIVVDDYDTPDTYPWEVQDPEPFEPIEAEFEVLATEEAPTGYRGRHRR
jgi:hypothetical protein